MAESLSIIASIAYIPAKLVVYAVVAHFGIQTFQPLRPKPWRRAVFAAALRAMIGVVLVIPLLGLGEWLQNLQHWESQTALVLSAYVLFYIPLRWFAWSLIAPLVNPEARRVRAVLIPSSSRDFAWRGIAVVASCLVDVILLAVTGTIPVGKFFC